MSRTKATCMLSILLMLSMVIGLAPTSPVFADGAKISGITLYPADGGAGAYLSTTAGCYLTRTHEVAAEEPSEWMAYFNYDENSLTLDNYNGGPIEFTSYSLANASLILAGDNTITVEGNGDAVYGIEGTMTGINLTITTRGADTGSLVIAATNSNAVYGIKTNMSNPISGGGTLTFAGKAVVSIDAETGSAYTTTVGAQAAGDIMVKDEASLFITAKTEGNYVTYALQRSGSGDRKITIDTTGEVRLSGRAGNENNARAVAADTLEILRTPKLTLKSNGLIISSSATIEYDAEKFDRADSIDGEFNVSVFTQKDEGDPEDKIISAVNITYDAEAVKLTTAKTGAEVTAALKDSCGPTDYTDGYGVNKSNTGLVSRGSGYYTSEDNDNPIVESKNYFLKVVLTPDEYAGYGFNPELDAIGVQVNGATAPSGTELTNVGGNWLAMYLPVAVESTPDPDTYTITFDAQGGTPDPVDAVTGTDGRLNSLPTVTRTGFDFDGWFTLAVGGTRVTTDTVFSTDTTIFAQWIAVPDTTPPSGEITVGTNKWNSFWNTVTFGLFAKSTQTVAISGDDDSGEPVTIQYYLAAAELSQAEAEAISGWETYTGPFNIDPNNKYIVYAKITDPSGNSAVVNSSGVIVYTDSTAVTVALNHVLGATDEQTATVNLNGNTIAKIMNDSDTLVLDTDYTLSGSAIAFAADYLNSLAEGNYTLIVHYNPFGLPYPESPLAGSQAPATTTISLTVSDVPIVTYLVTVENGSGGGEYAEGATVNITAGGAPTGQVFDQWTSEHVAFADANSASTSFTMPAQAVTVTATYKDAPPATYAIDVQNDGSGTASADKTVASEGETITLSASANDGYEFLEWQVLSSNVTIIDDQFAMPAADVSVKALFKENVSAPSYSYTVTEGADDSWQKGSTQGAKFVVDGDFALFEGVSINGKDLAPANYTATEGSVIITLHQDYLETLGAGEYTLSFNFTGFNADTSFTIMGAGIPKTGDLQNIAFFFALLLLSLAALLGMALYYRRNRIASE